MTVKRLLSAADVARLLGWTTERTRNWIIREGCGTRRMGRWYTTPNMLREAFPELYTELMPDLLSDAPELPADEDNESDEVM
jgi:hypothetical protein